jgi:hypothetical protein
MSAQTLQKKECAYKRDRSKKRIFFLRRVERHLYHLCAATKQGTTLWKD